MDLQGVFLPCFPAGAEMKHPNLSTTGTIVSMPTFHLSVIFVLANIYNLNETIFIHSVVFLQLCYMMGWDLCFILF